MKVRVYYNLHRKCLSVQDYSTRKVIAHYASVNMADVKFVVSQAGRKRVLAERKKNVHAFIVGELLSYTTRSDDTGFSGDRVTYNPYKYDSFVRVDDESKIDNARLVNVSGRSITVIE